MAESSESVPSAVAEAPATAAVGIGSISPGDQLSDSNVHLPLWSKVKGIEDAFVATVKYSISFVSNHQNEAIGVAAVSGLLLLRGPRRFLYRNTVQRFWSEENKLHKVSDDLKVFKRKVESATTSAESSLKSEKIGQEDLQRGYNDLRSSGRQIIKLVKSIQNVESDGTDILGRLRTIPGRESLELRAEVASIVAKLKDERHLLQNRIEETAKLGVRV